jgi:myo-inositol-1(or 4)-monophosphatase
MGMQPPVGEFGWKAPEFIWPGTDGGRDGAADVRRDKGPLDQMEAAIKQAPGMLEQVIAAVRDVAAREIMPRYLKVAHHRKSDGSLFTEADLAAQESLARALPGIYQGPIVAEEMTPEQHAEYWLAGEEGLWCVDPIDGTSNFVNGLPYFAVSVALMKKGRSVLGVVFDPVADEMFYAEKGGGAFLNGERLPIKEHVPRLRNAMAQVDFKRLPEALARELVASPPYSSQRNFGASTLEWCYVAAGRFDVYLHGGQKLWDYAAGSLILEEAGGLMSSLGTEDFWEDALWQRSVIAARESRLFDAWKHWIRARQ